MKTKSMLAALAMGFMSVAFANAKEETKEVKVYGNCGMCEKRIETAAKAVEGVSAADWDKKTKMMKFSFDPVKTSELKVEKAVAAVGHDTNKVKATDEAYNKLDACCKYERPKKKE